MENVDKKSIIGLILIGVVLIVGWIIVPNILNEKNSPVNEPVVQTEEIIESREITVTKQEQSVAAELSNADESVFEKEEVLPEETFTVKTNKIEVVLTNKGGDVISYKLLDHFDYETNDLVQITDNIADNNRACSISFGSSQNNAIDDIFNVEKIDDYTYMFTKDIFYDGRKVSVGKKYTFKDDEYMFRLDVLMHDSNAKGLDSNGKSYTIRTAPQIGPSYEYRNGGKGRGSDFRDFIIHNGKKVKKITLADNKTANWGKEINWCGIGSKYFVSLVVPSQTENISDITYSTMAYNDKTKAQAFVERKSFTGSDISDTYYMYFGTRSEKEIKKYNDSKENAWNISGKRLTECIQGSGFLSWLEVIIKFFLELLHKVISNWGVCIIVMTILIKFALFPISKKQTVSSIKMQELQPKMQALQKKYANDQQKLQAEMSKLYKEANYNPLSGCLPIVIQMFILIAVFRLFNTYFEFRGASFIPNWIPDLSRPDSIFSWEKEIPFISSFTQNNIRLLPIIYVITQLVSGKVSQNVNSNPANPQSQMSMKLMMYGMPVLFFFILYNYPSGLSIYWIVSNIFQIIQQIILNKYMAKLKGIVPVKKNK